MSVKPVSYIQYFSNFLSIVTVTICFILKVPQILKLIKLKSTKGINTMGLLMELTSYTIMMSYNYRKGYAILDYLEYPVILLQEFVLIFLVLKYNETLNLYSLIGAAIYFSIAGGFLFGFVPIGLLAFLVPLCTPIGASSKVVQLVGIIKAKNSESVSLLTWFISAFTNFTRIFTVLVDSGDLTLLLNFIVNALLSSSVFLAAIMYRHPKTD